MLLATAMLAAACGDDGGSSEAEGAATTAAPAATEGGSEGSESEGAGDEAGLEELVAAAKEEGALTFYSADTDEANKAITDGFTEEYDIPVHVLRIATGGLVERFAGEQNAGVESADVLKVATYEIFEDEPDWFLPLDEELVPNLGDYPEESVSERNATLEIHPSVITYNTDLVAEEDVPTSWEDMTDPRWQGQILLTDPRTTPTYMGWAELMRELYGVEYLEALAEQDFDLVESATPGAQQVAAGAYAFNFPAAPAHSAELRAQGAPVGVAYIEEGSNGPAQEQGIVANALHPNAARLFMHYSLTEEASQLMCDVVETAVPLEGIEGCLALSDTWEPVIFEVWQDPEAEAVLLGGLGLAR